MLNSIFPILACSRYIGYVIPPAATSIAEPFIVSFLVAIERKRMFNDISMIDTITLSVVVGFIMNPLIWSTELYIDAEREMINRIIFFQLRPSA
jgi:hypothetical protein